VTGDIRKKGAVRSLGGARVRGETREAGRVVGRCE